MTAILVDTLSPNATQTYEVKVEPGLRHAATHEIERALRCTASDSKVFFLTDHNVWSHGRARALHAVLDRAFQSVTLHTVLAGEGCKTWDSARFVLAAMEDANIGRGDIVVTCGGGTISDLGGFCASLFKRGVALVHMPTTLLAMVDAAIGGKTGVNAGTKNCIGTFYSPSLVLADTEFLSTLPTRELIAGYAEAIKHGVIWSEDLFDIIEAGGRPDDMDPVRLTSIIRMAANCKARAVTMDPFERKDIRALLNFGHTFGHALEACTNFGIPHGHAVAVGMALATQLAVFEQRCSVEVFDRLDATLKACGLPTRVKQLDPGKYQISAERIFGFMLQDKKTEGSTLPLILPVEIGKGIVDRGISKVTISGFLAEAVLYDD